ncbi:hypothetical protein D3C79_944070 [compost metagenome]
MGTHEAVVQLQGTAQVHAQGQRVVGLLATVDAAEAQLLWRATLQGLGHRVVLEHQNAVEQRVTALPGPALDIEQRRVLVLTQAKVERLHCLQPVGHGLGRLWRGDHRQGVDEQTDLLLDARQLQRPARHGGAEGHRGLPAVALQQQ